MCTTSLAAGRLARGGGGGEERGVRGKQVGGGLRRSSRFFLGAPTKPCTPNTTVRRASLYIHTQTLLPFTNRSLSPSPFALLGSPVPPSLGSSDASSSVLWECGRVTRTALPRLRYHPRKVSSAPSPSRPASLYPPTVCAPPLASSGRVLR